MNNLLLSKFIFFLLLFTTSILSSANSLTHCGSGMASVEQIKLYEGEKVYIRLFDKNKNLVFPPIEYLGEFIPLCDYDKFLLISNQRHYHPTSSFLLTIEGRIVKKFNFGEIAQIDKSEDNKIFWIQQFIVVDRQPLTKVQVYDNNGTKIASQSFTHKQNYLVKSLDVSYSIKVLKPKYPG